MVDEQVTRGEFNELAARVTALEKGTTTSGPSGPQSEFVVPKPAVKVSGDQYSITGTMTANKATKFTYLQLAVRGDKATDLALSPGTVLAAGQTKALTGAAAGAGDYTTWVAWSVDGKTWVDGPKTSFTVKAAAPVVTPVTPVVVKPGSSKVPLVGKSKLPFNSLVFRQSKSDMEQFGSRRGVPMDGLLYFTGRQGWDDFKWHPDGQKEMLAAGLIVVTSMPHAPESEGNEMNQRGADNSYRNQQRDLGKWLADNGFNQPTHYIRVNWELNGDWYAWSLNRPGGAAAGREAIKNYVVNMRAGGLTKVKFGMCNNKGPNQSGASGFDAFPGAEYIDNMGIDQYDMWAPSYSQGDWDREMAKGPSARITAEFAKKQGITWSWDEGGNTHGDSNQGGDNPNYWDYRKAEILRNISNFAYDTTYDDPGAPASLMHDFARNPKSWDRYRQLWRP